MVPAHVTPRCVVIGASAGALDALGVLLPALPASTPFPVIVVVHLPAGRPSALVDIFAARCQLPVAHPLDKLPLGRGIWFAPPDYHLLVEADGSFSLSADDPVAWSRPSIDVLFESAGEAFGSDLVCVVLTGANADGANGAAAARQRGAWVVVQDPATAEAAPMPRAAIERASPHLVASLSDISAFLVQRSNAP